VWKRWLNGSPFAFVKEKQMPHDNAYNYIYLTGIILSFLVGFIGIGIGLKNSRKTLFINSITSARIKYIQDLRNSVSEFCGLVFTYHFTDLSKNPDEELSIQKKYDSLKYLIGLHLNVEDRYFDPKILSLIKQIRDLKIGSKPIEIESKIDELILIMQYLLKFEWEGAKLESRKGIVSQHEKDSLYKKYEQLHQKRVS
jgi:hypothetical protein